MIKYQVRNGKVVRSNPFCPRCGKGVMMADRGKSVGGHVENVEIATRKRKLDGSTYKKLDGSTSKEDCHCRDFKSMENEPRKALLITIGVDTGKVNGGFRGPFYENREYEYIPVPEAIMKQISKGKWKWTGEYVKDGKETYRVAPGNRMKIDLLATIPPKFRQQLKDVAIHHDPDFRNLTYGDGKMSSPRGKQLVKLNPNDLLVFCPSLENRETKENDRGRFIIGYFTVENVYDFTDPDFKTIFNCTRSKIIERFKDKNAHFSREFALAWGDSREELLDSYLDEEEADLVLVTGQAGRSGLCKKAIRITMPHGSKYFVIPQNLVRDLGLKKPPMSLRYERGWKWVKSEQHFRNLLSILGRSEVFI